MTRKSIANEEQQREIEDQKMIFLGLIEEIYLFLLEEQELIKSIYTLVIYIRKAMNSATWNITGNIENAKHLTDLFLKMFEVLQTLEAAISKEEISTLLVAMITELENQARKIMESGSSIWIKERGTEQINSLISRIAATETQLSQVAQAAKVALITTRAKLKESQERESEKLQATIKEREKKRR